MLACCAENERTARRGSKDALIMRAHEEGLTVGGVIAKHVIPESVEVTEPVKLNPRVLG